MDIGKQQIFEERRKERAQNVHVQFRDSQHFDVLEQDEDGTINIGGFPYKIKYIGKLADEQPTHDDFCTCKSFYHGNTDEFKKASPHAFQCKHLICAREKRYQ